MAGGAYVGILYKITCLVPSKAGVLKIYVGKTSYPLAKRWGTHKRQARYGKKGHLYNAMRAYGIENFHIEVMEVFNDAVSLNKAEVAAIARLRTQERDFGYNEMGGGQGGPMPLAVKKAISAALTRANSKPEVKARRRAATILALADPKVKAKRTAALIASFARDEVRARRREGRERWRAVPENRERRSSWVGNASRERWSRPGYREMISVKVRAGRLAYLARKASLLPPITAEMQEAKERQRRDRENERARYRYATDPAYRARKKASKIKYANHQPLAASI